MEKKSKRRKKKKRGKKGGKKKKENEEREALYIQLKRCRPLSTRQDRERIRLNCPQFL